MNQDERTADRTAHLLRRSGLPVEGASRRSSPALGNHRHPKAGGMSHLRGAWANFLDRHDTINGALRASSFFGVFAMKLLCPFNSCHAHLTLPELHETNEARAAEAHGWRRVAATALVITPMNSAERIAKPIDTLLNGLLVSKGWRAVHLADPSRTWLLGASEADLHVFDIYAAQMRWTVTAQIPPHAEEYVDSLRCEAGVVADLRLDGSETFITDDARGRALLAAAEARQRAKPEGITAYFTCTCCLVRMGVAGDQERHAAWLDAHGWGRRDGRWFCSGRCASLAGKPATPMQPIDTTAFRQVIERERSIHDAPPLLKSDASTRGKVGSR